MCYGWRAGKIQGLQYLQATKNSGYQRETIFVVDEKTGENVSASAQDSHIKIYRRPRTSFRLIKDRSRIAKDLAQRGSRQKIPFPSNALLPINEVHHNLAFRQQFLGQFLSTYVPDSNSAALGGPLHGTTWLVLIPGLAELTKALDSSLLSISIARLSRMKGDQQLLLDSLKFYGQGLRDLQQALQDPALMYREETLAACMALSMYEVVECSTESRIGWASHSDGCARLIRLRGAAAHASGLAHQVFLSFRTQGIIKAIQDRRSTYLADPEWTTQVWKEIPKTPLDQLLDIMAGLPSVLELADQIQGRKARIPLLLQVINSCWNLDVIFQNFDEQFRNKFSSPLYRPEFSTLPNDADDTEFGKVFPIAFRFVDLQTAHICMLYWTSLIILWSNLGDMYRLIDSMQSTNHPELDEINGDMCSQISQLRPFGQRIEQVSLARNICQSIEFCLRDEFRAFGAGIIVIPLYISILTFEQHPECAREIAWTKKVINNVEEKGFRITKYFDRDSPVDRS
ncbi:MAG: hypothetical protein M1818_002275 [Claussenomyces sp. TS43310]|nr:MAG: hypothetical protein M1818_002275 [Claussenomyces sp. TS43310]